MRRVMRKSKGPHESNSTRPLRDPRRAVSGGISQPVSACRFEREGNSNKRRHTMNVLVATDGSKCGQWRLN